MFKELGLSYGAAARNRAKVSGYAQQLVDFLGVPLIEERYGKWGELVQREEEISGVTTSPSAKRG
jgi:hypothetical protein